MSPWDVPPLNIAYLAGYLREKGIEVNIIDALILNLTDPQLHAELARRDPDLVGFTANGFSATYAMKAIRYLKQTGWTTPIVIGGVFGTVSFEYILDRGLADVVVLGEGEETLYQLVQALERTGWDAAVLEKILGIAFQREGIVVRTPERPLIKVLDTLPFPAWDLFPPLTKYSRLRGVIKRPYLPILTSRGCPHKCIWCSKNIFGRRIRFRSAENIFQEILHDVEVFGIKELIIMDDSFTELNSRAIALCKLLIARRLDLSINIYNGVRADRLNYKMLRYLKAAGVNRITIGVESGNQRVVTQIGKELDLAYVIEVSRIIKRLGFVFDAFFMLGLPFDTEGTMEQTIQFAIALDPDHAYFFTTTPFPGTELYDLVAAKHWFVKKYTASVPAHIVEGEMLYATPAFTVAMVKAKFAQAYRRFYFRLSKIASLILLYFKLILKYRSFTELRWLISQALFFLN